MGSWIDVLPRELSRADVCACFPSQVRGVVELWNLWLWMRRRRRERDPASPFLRFVELWCQGCNVWFCCGGVDGGLIVNMFLPPFVSGLWSEWCCCGLDENDVYAQELSSSELPAYLSGRPFVQYHGRAFCWTVMLLLYGTVLVFWGSAGLCREWCCGSAER